MVHVSPDLAAEGVNDGVARHVQVAGARAGNAPSVTGPVVVRAADNDLIGGEGGIIRHVHCAQAVGSDGRKRPGIELLGQDGIAAQIDGADAAAVVADEEVAGDKDCAVVGHIQRTSAQIGPPGIADSQIVGDIDGAITANRHGAGSAADRGDVNGAGVHDAVAAYVKVTLAAGSADVQLASHVQGRVIED